MVQLAPSKHVFNPVASLKTFQQMESAFDQKTKRKCQDQ